MPIAQAVYKPRTVDLADPLGARISIFGPAIPFKQTLSSSVQRYLCHSRWWAAGGFPPTTSQKYAKFFLAFSTSTLEVFLTTCCFAAALAVRM